MRTPDKLELNFDPQQLTIGQMEQLEEITSMSLSEIAAQMQSGKFTAKVLKAIVFLLMSAQDPDFTIEDAANVKVTALNAAGVAGPPAEAAVAEVAAVTNGR